MKHGTTTGYQYHGCRCNECKEAGVAASRAWALKNPEKRAKYMKRYKREYLYGVTQEMFALLQAQHPACAICGDTGNGYPQIDHNHETGKVRGLLCTFCNQAIGLFKENASLLAKAQIYLK